MILHRFWMGSETYQNPTVHNLVSTIATRLWLTTPGLAWAFPMGADPDFWAPMFIYLDFRRVPEADFEVEGRRYGVFARDWRVHPPAAWLEMMGERELSRDLRPATEGSRPCRLRRHHEG